MKQLLYILFITLLISSCGTNQKNENFVGEMEVSKDVETFAVSRQAGSGKSSVMKEQNYSSDKKIIKDANVGVEVEDYSEYRILLDSLVHVLNGYVSNDNLNKSDYAINGNLTIRIPEQNFNIFINLLEKGSQKILYKKLCFFETPSNFVTH